MLVLFVLVMFGLAPLLQGGNHRCWSRDGVGTVGAVVVIAVKAAGGYSVVACSGHCQGIEGWVVFWRW